MGLELFRRVEYTRCGRQEGVGRFESIGQVSELLAFARAYRQTERNLTPGQRLTSSRQTDLFNLSSIPIIRSTTVPSSFAGVTLSS